MVLREIEISDESTLREEVNTMTRLSLQFPDSSIYQRTDKIRMQTDVQRD